MNVEYYLLGLAFSAEKLLTSIRNVIKLPRKGQIKMLKDCFSNFFQACISLDL